MVVGVMLYFERLLLSPEIKKMPENLYGERDSRSLGLLPL